MDRKELLEVIFHIRYFSLVILIFFYLQNQFFGWNIQSTNQLSGVDALAGVIQIIMFLFFILIEEKWSVSNLRTLIVKNIFQDYSTTLVMSLPAVFLLFRDQLLSAASVSTEYCEKYAIISVAFFSLLILRKQMLATQLLAIAFVVKGLSLIPQYQNSSDSNDAIALSQNNQTAMLVAAAVLFNGLSWVTLEKVLKKTSEPSSSLWIRGLQLNLFIVPLALLPIVKAWSEGEPVELIGSNVFAWFFVIFKAAQQMMELFVLKIVDSVHKCLAFSAALTIMGIMQNPVVFNLYANSEQYLVKAGTGLVLAGLSLYIILDHSFSRLTEPSDEELEDVSSHSSPSRLQDSLLKGISDRQLAPEPYLDC